ncbi:hypothetical protein [Candidatus Similichlamydia epinepheli]|uniref:hypothetical protein n=1 Tax=Candidatus Similichlamydia epinepheli TaxID=1903953 RepID=UPI000D3A0F04|nr:hypothetical protein [Candidatus Similichlamydia epinepheli]
MNPINNNGPPHRLPTISEEVEAADAADQSHTQSNDVPDTHNHNRSSDHTSAGGMAGRNIRRVRIVLPRDSITTSDEQIPGPSRHMQPEPPSPAPSNPYSDSANSFDNEVCEILRDGNRHVQKIVRGLTAGVGLAASAFLMASLANTDNQWVGYSVAAATAFAAQVLLSANPLRGITYFISRIAQSVGGGGNNGDTTDSANQSPPHNRLRRFSSAVVDRIHSMGNNRRPETTCNANPKCRVGGKEVCMKTLLQDNPVDCSEILVHGRALLLSIALSLFSIASLSYVIAITEIDKSKIPSTTTAPTTSSSSSTEANRNEIDAIIPSDVNSLIPSDAAENLLIEALGVESTLLACHVVNILCCINRMFVIRRRGRRLRELIESREDREERSHFRVDMSSIFDWQNIRGNIPIPNDLPPSTIIELDEMGENNNVGHVDSTSTSQLSSSLQSVSVSVEVVPDGQQDEESLSVENDFIPPPEGFDDCPEYASEPGLNLPEDDDLPPPPPEAFFDCPEYASGPGLNLPEDDLPPPPPPEAFFDCPEYASGPVLTSHGGVESGSVTSSDERDVTDSSSPRNSPANLLRRFFRLNRPPSPLPWASAASEPTQPNDQSQISADPQEDSSNNKKGGKRKKKEKHLSRV